MAQLFDSFSHLVTLRARRSERAGASETLVVRDLARGSAIRFLGSVYATAQESSSSSRSPVSSSSRILLLQHVDFGITDWRVWSFHLLSVCSICSDLSYVCFCQIYALHICYIVTVMLLHMYPYGCCKYEMYIMPVSLCYDLWIKFTCFCFSYVSHDTWSSMYFHHGYKWYHDFND